MSAYQTTKKELKRFTTYKKNEAPQEISERFATYCSRYTVTKPEDINFIFRDYKFEEQEHFLTITLDSGNHISDFSEVATGLTNKVPVHAREAFRFAVKKNAVSVMFLHNHPSGNTEPSDDDLAITRILCASGKILQIPVLDHIILGKGGFTSLCRRMPEIFEATMKT